MPIILNSRERVALALQHKEADRVPMDIGGRLAGIRHEAYEKLVKYLKLDCPVDNIAICPFLTAKEPHIKLLEKLETDFYWVNVKGPEYVTVKKNDDCSYINEWGITVKIVGNYAQRITHPLKGMEISEIEKYNWPDVEAPERYKGLKDYAKYLYENTDFSLVLNPVSGGIFEMCQHLRGLEDFFIDIMANKDFAHALLDKLLYIEMKMTERFLEEIGDYVDIVALSDDYASTESLLISPELFDEFFSPRYKKFTDMIKTKTDGKAKVLLHSCGAVFDLIDHFIEMGIDILNPIQPTARGMNPNRLKETFGTKICFHGGIDSQYILSEGSPEDVEKYVAEAISDLAHGGGYILAPSHHIQYNVPPENIVAMYEIAKNQPISC